LVQLSVKAVLSFVSFDKGMALVTDEVKTGAVPPSRITLFSSFLHDQSPVITMAARRILNIFFIQNYF